MLMRVVLCSRWQDQLSPEEFALQLSQITEAPVANQHLAAQVGKEPSRAQIPLTYPSRAHIPREHERHKARTRGAVLGAGSHRSTCTQMSTHIDQRDRLLLHVDRRM